jgi:cytochrome b6
MFPARAFQASLDFLADRVPIQKMSFQSLVRQKEVPVHRMSWAYYLGGLALFLFLIQLVTGLMLLFYYEPTVSDAYASVDFITRQVTGGALIRNLHAWAASALIGTVLLHLLTTFAMKAFGRPRELTWLSGVFLLLFTFAFGFTGYLLPWNQIAVNATKVGLQSIVQAGQYLPGPLADLPARIKEVIQGEATVGQATLSRFHAIHVIVLPLVAFGLIGVHLLSVQLHGMSQGVERPTGRTERFFPFFILRDFWLWGIAFLALFTLALCLPFESFSSFPLFQPFDPLGSTPEGIKPEWYFYFVYYPLELLPFWAVMLGQTVAIAGLLATPWLFTRTSRRSLRVLTLAVAVYLIVVTLFGHDVSVAFKGGA